VRDGHGVTHTYRQTGYRVVKVDVGASCSLMNLHHWSVVVAHRHLRVARVTLHHFTHCFQLHTHTHTHTHRRTCHQSISVVLRLLSVSLQPSVRFAQHSIVSLLRSQAKYCDQRRVSTCMSVCVLAYLQISRLNFTRFSVYVTCSVRRSVVL